ncbi:MAG: glucose-1-phosphate adenylyltransferase [Planctomycetes bacterium]|nr:glucose-1-phosphate adenylyltransferase [Planctomycetota bacterium]
MGGGAGTRLHPLTQRRAKPAVPLAAKFRLIDIPISNCLNSGLNRIYILTQFNSTSLNRHIYTSYHFDRFSRGFVEILAAQQSPQYHVEHSWYEGTADAVRKNLTRVKDTGCEDVLILSGDQIYRMDFREILGTHRGTGESDRAHVTIAGLLVPRERARSFGIMRISPEGEVLAFIEKPGKNDALFEGLEAPPELLERFGMRESREPLYLANMGIYVFGVEQLEEALEGGAPDFGKEVLPSLLGRMRVRAHLFQGYWEDIGTIRAFHQANIELATPSPRFDFYRADAPIYTRARLLPATKLERAAVKSSLIADGCMIDEAVIESSLIGVRSIIGKGCTIRNTYVMGADYYESGEDVQAHRGRSSPQVGIGEGTHIENAIIDKNAQVGRNVSITNRQEHTTYDDGRVVIREGIVVVPRGAVIPDGYSI